MNQETYKSREYILNLKTVLKSLFLQWKAVLLVAFVMAVIVCGIRLRQDMQAYNAQIKAAKETAAQAALPKEERIANIINGLPEEERGTVEYITGEQKTIDELKAYLNNSILMQTDLTDQDILEMTFDVIADKSADVSAVLKAYQTYYHSVEFQDAIKQLFTSETESEYIDELIYNTGDENVLATNENAGYFSISVIIPNELDYKNVEKSQTEAILDYREHLNKKYPHTVSLTSSELLNIYNSEAIEKRKLVYDEINGLENNIKEEKKSLTEGQSAAISAISAINSESTEPTATENTDGEIDEVEIIVPRYNKKNAVIGFLMGLVIYAIVCIILMISKRQINSATDIENYIDTRLIGEVYYKKDARGIERLLHSNIASKLCYKNKLNKDEQLKGLKESMASICKRSGLDKISIINMTKFILQNELITCFGETGNLGINIVEFTEETNEISLLEVKNIIVILGEGVKVDVIGKLLAICADYDIVILGSVYIGEI